MTVISSGCQLDDLEHSGSEENAERLSDGAKRPSLQDGGETDDGGPRSGGGRNGALWPQPDGRSKSSCCGSGCHNTQGHQLEGTSLCLAGGGQGRQAAMTADKDGAPIASAAIEYDEEVAPGGSGFQGHVSSAAGPVCVKCRVRPAELIANQREPYCGECLQQSLMYRFRTAVNKHALIQANDAVLLAFSGGHASTVLLHFLKEMQSHATTPQAAAADRGKTVFRLGLIFVSEAAALSRPGYDTKHELDSIHHLTASFESAGCRVHIVGLEELFLGHNFALPQTAMEATGAPDAQNLGEETGQEAVGAEEGSRLGSGQSERAPRAERLDAASEQLASARERLRLVLAGVTDGTVQEDLVEMIRTEVVQQVAVEHGYTKIAVGTCATRLAAQVLTGTVKGRGFSLPASLQHVDRRHAVPVVAPLRDCVIKELALLCNINRWPTVFVPRLATGPETRPSLNRLTHDFLHLIEDDLPGRTHTILRTAGKLQPFPFNAFPSLPQGQSVRLHPAAPEGRLSPGQHSGGPELCALCRAPLSTAEETRGEGEDGTGDGAKRSAEANGKRRVDPKAVGDSGAVLRVEGALQELSLTEREGGRGADDGAFACDERKGSGVHSLAPLSDALLDGSRRGDRPTCCRSCLEQVLGDNEGDKLFATLPWVARREGPPADEAAKWDRRRAEVDEFLL